MKVSEVISKAQVGIYTAGLLYRWRIPVEYEVYNTYEDETSAITSLVQFKNKRLVVEFNCMVVLEIDSKTCSYSFDRAIVAGLPSPELFKQAVLQALQDLLGFADYVALKEEQYRDCMTLVFDFPLKSIEDFQ